MLYILSILCISFTTAAAVPDGARMSKSEGEAELVGKSLIGDYDGNSFTWNMNKDGSHSIDMPGVNVTDKGTYTLASR
jgi:hypothetical protein